jgi:hypothetical protein
MCDNSSSPFAQTLSYTLTVEPFLNPTSKQYQNIIVIDKMPAGPLAQLVSRFAPSKLSRFQVNDDNNSHCCKFAIRRNYHILPNDFLTADDIPTLLGYLSTNGYTINYDITKIVQKSIRIVCVFFYSM